MTWFFHVVTSSIGKKQCMAISGLGLCLFLTVHLAGNLLLFAGPKVFNGYAATIEANPLLIPSEIVLLFTFLVHICFAIPVTLENRKARPIRYVVSASKGRRTFASSTMWLSGVVTLVFIVLHLIDFKFASRNGKTLYDLVVLKFQSWLYVVWYILASSILALHLSHGFQSAFRSLGLEHPKYTPFVEGVGKVFSVIVAVGYSLIPLGVFLGIVPSQK